VESTEFRVEGFHFGRDLQSDEGILSAFVRRGWEKHQGASEEKRRERGRTYTIGIVIFSFDSLTAVSLLHDGCAFEIFTVSI